MYIRSIVIASLVFSSVAFGQTEETNYPAERYSQSLDRMGVWGVDSAAPVPSGAFGINLWLGYSNDPISVYAANDFDNRLGRFVGNRVGGELSAYYGFLKRFQIGVRLPFVAYQNRPSSQSDLSAAPLTDIAANGIGDVAATLKVSLFDKPEKFNLALGVEGTFPTSGGSDYLGHDQWSVTPELMASVHLAKLRILLNVGWLILPEDNVSIVPVHDEFVLKVGGAFDVTEKLAIGASWQMGTLAYDFFNSRIDTYGEFVGGVTYRGSDNLEVFLGGGAGITNGYGSPDYRGILGVRFDKGFVTDADGDGIADEDDKCMNEGEDFDKIEDTDGCPETDADGDGILDENDKAPTDPEDKDGFEDEDGVPDLDNDKDGIADADDKCPMDPENKNDYQDDDGCPDSKDKDGDGVNDDVDKCPEQAEDIDKIADEDGCPEEDADGDGVTDVADGCPMKPGPVENNGCPDTDRDGDGVVDRLDNCPDEAGTAANQGCKKKQDVRISAGKLEILKKVYFSSGKSKIRSKSYRLLRQVANVLKNQPRIKGVRVEGHTDSKGRDSRNMTLSQNRAQAVVDFLVKEGVDPSRLSPQGYGEERPVDSNRSRRGRANNRRVEFVITDQ